MKIGVVGAGNMGSGIAQKYATEGHQVVLCDNAESGLKRGQSLIESTLGDALSRGIFDENRMQQITNRISYTQNFSALKDADLVIEAVFEDLEVKRSLFRTLDGVCDSKTILATNTSSFRVCDLASVRPDRVIGLHYFYHPAKNRLVEVIRTNFTSEATFDTVYTLQESIGKIPITSADSPGFVVNRFFVPWLNEAMRIVEAGMANIATVEWASKRVFGIGMGPFELMNVTGAPITLHACTTLYRELGDFYKPSALIEPHVEKRQLWNLEGAIDESAFDAVADQLQQVVFTVARQMVLVEKVCSIDECDLGARVGLRWRQGPFEMLAKTEPSLRPKKVLYSRGDDGIATITLNRPDALNAIDAQLVQDLESAFDAAISDINVQGIVLEGKGKCFAAGADTQFFVQNMRSKEIQRIVDFAAFGQAVLRKIDLCPKPVVAIVHGMTLGGGLELALACDRIVCVDGAQLGFPETGIGIYPGLGGTQRTPRRVGVPLARWLILSGEILTAQRALEIGLVDQVCTKDQAMRIAKQCIAQSAASEARETGQSWKDLATVFALPLADLKDAKPAPVQTDVLRYLKRLSFKAPLALQVADDLISTSDRISLEEGLELETKHLADIFSSNDALIGVSSIGNGRPVFTGS